jgi:hypothetical protein
MKRLAFAVALGACAGSAALAADFPQPAPVPAQLILQSRGFVDQ